MNKDKVYGFGILLVFLLGLIFYTIVVPLPIIQFVLNGSNSLTDWGNGYLADLGLPVGFAFMLFWFMIPTFGGVFLMSFIIMWIGWTMATTPPPEPIDLDSLDLDDDDDDEEEDSSD